MATTHYLWDRLENNVIGEFDGGGNVVASYVTKPDLFGDVMSQRRADSGARYYQKDALGTVTELTDQGGNVTDTFRATAFGETAESTGPTTSPFKYVGGKGYYVDSGLDSLAVRRRRYSANTARWLSVDPLSQTMPSESESESRTRSTRELWPFKGRTGLSPLHFPILLEREYTAVGNSPLTQIDPSGEKRDILDCIREQEAACGANITSLPYLPACALWCETKWGTGAFNVQECISECMHVAHGCPKPGVGLPPGTPSVLTWVQEACIQFRIFKYCK